MNDMKQAMMITLTGQSGEKYDFHVYPFDSDVDSTSAVFAVAERKSDSGKYVVVDIGQSENMPGWIAANRSKTRRVPSENYCLCVHQDIDWGSRKTKEADLISRYYPRVRMFAAS